MWNDPYHWQISSVYLTARQMIRPWQEPGVKEAARRPRIGLNWQLGAPAAGRNTANTLYLCADLDDAERLAPVLGGLVDDLMKQAYARVGKTNDPLDPPLLLVIDEAGNWPMRNLPGRISTCAGLGIQMLLVYLLPSWLLRQVAPGQALLVHGTLRPAHLHGRYWYLDPDLYVLATGKRCSRRARSARSAAARSA